MLGEDKEQGLIFPAEEEGVPAETGDALRDEAKAAGLFLDRELSWLQFNLRVLEEAGDKTVPLFERLKFLGIYCSNLEEFFMVRVGSLTHRAALLPDDCDEKTGCTAGEQVANILAEIAAQQAREEKIYRSILADMREAGIDVVDFHKISKSDEVIAKKYFSEIRPMLSPRVADGSHPFPFIANREVYAAASIGKGDDFRLGLVSLLRLPPWRVFESEGRQKVFFTAELVRHYISQLFKKQEVRECVLLQVTRNADVFIDDDLRSYDADFRASMEKMLRKRKRQQPVRLVISGKPSGKLLAALVKDIRVPEANVFLTKMPFDLSFGSGVKKTPEMKYPERRSQKTVKLRKGDFFRYLEKKDILLAYPFQSMTPFVDFLYEAADDPDVLSIRITLYRLSSTSKVAAALAYAADRGKSVLCLLELRARFDEQNNIDYSEALEEAGCQIIYGLPEMKVHSKLCLVTRKHGNGVQYFTQVGTGNYNEVTSEQYTDLSVITSNEQVGRDAAQTFEALATGQTPPETEALWVAPKSYRTRVLEFIEKETEKETDGRIAIKVNSMNDIGVMESLVRASRAGAKIELYIRGICCLRPGVPGYTENIAVHSVVGRYLEHSRIFAFGEDKGQRIFVGSGDLLNRNTRRRVEAFIECTTPETREGVLAVLDALRADREKSRTMQPDGTYIHEEIVPGTASHDTLYTYFGTKILEPLEPEKKHGFLWRLFHRSKQ